MWTKEDENWWSSTQKGLDFKDIDGDLQQGDDPLDTLPDDFIDPLSVVFNETLNQKKNIYSIEKIITKECLENILRFSDSRSDPSTNDLVNAINNLIMERKVYFNFKALSNKVILLDKAIETKRGHVIKKVLVYLDSTLLPKIFYPLLISRPIALNHLELHYMQEHRLDALSTLYTMTGKTNTSRLFLAHCPHSTKTAKNLMNIQHYQLQFQPLLSNFESDAVKKYRGLLEYLSRKNVTQYSTAVEYFVECVKSNDFDKIDEDIRKLLLSVEQADWVIMNVCMYLKKYDKLEKRFLQKNKSSWLKNFASKSSLQPETLVLGMAEHKPEKLVLESYLSLVKDDKRITLGHKLGCYDYVIRLYCDKRDRNGLIDYKSKFPSSSPFFEEIEKTLNDHVSFLYSVIFINCPRLALLSSVLYIRYSSCTYLQSWQPRTVVSVNCIIFWCYCQIFFRL